jgi:DNA-binding NarL/FixJ family response regulator
MDVKLMIKVLIVDDQTLMRDGLKTILDLEDDIKVVATAKDGEDAIEKVKNEEPNVILMDIRMPVKNGVESTKIIKENFKNIKIIMLTTFQDDEYIIEALANGADGYLLKDIQGDNLIQAIRDVYNGQLMINPQIAMKLAQYVKKSTVSEKHVTESFDLSERELEVVRLMVKGFTNKKISKELFISEGTVKNYISSIYSKIGTSDRTQAVLLLKNYQ